MGILDDDLEELVELKKQASQFHPLELNEMNVQAIFNRCLATPETKEVVYGTLFPITRGWDAGSETMIEFDCESLLANLRNIEYLFGQLKEAHRAGAINNLTLDDYNVNYKGEHWTSSKKVLLMFLYLGVTEKRPLIAPFWGPHIKEILPDCKEQPYTSLMAPSVKLTLSPNDPAFPAWWETHKSEWEQ